ncbi:chymotrypsin-2-like [Cylas formicarius]|uniref:chymotrypsin-2-like n=1 Tax=Cylas formicarius TaxID=197179 RepID=UPI002958C70A|nr:chymotrypsin-2-like [Cylas formicarius]
MRALIAAAALVACVAASPAHPTVNPGQRIAGGDNAARNQFPYQVSVQIGSGANFRHYCGGSIIGTTYVLTAAHCFDFPQVPALYRIVAGVLNLNDINVGEQVRAITRIVNHELYPGNNVVAPNDIAVARVASPFAWTVNVQPIDLPAPNKEPSGYAFLSGWGSLGANNPAAPNTLQFVEVPIVHANECRVRLDVLLLGRPHPLDVNTNICSGPARAIESACGGDSGGPLALHGELVGVVSWGLTPCGTIPNAVSVYAKVTSFLDWIERQAPDLQT